MVTVLLATYQGKQYLEQQLDSILAQTVPVRIFVSDDGSDDGTREMLLQYQNWYPKQVFLKHREKDVAQSENHVPPAAQNFFWLLTCAAQDGDSDYVMFCDQDDVWFNHKVRRLLREMKQVEAAEGIHHPILVHSDMEVVDEELELIAPSFFAYQHCDPERTSFGEVLVENPVTGGALMMNRALLRLVTDRSTKTAKLPPTCCMHDWWIALVASCFGTIACVREPLYQYRQHGTNTLGAKQTGSLEDLQKRLGRRQQVRENYQKMLAQALAFGRRYGGRMGEAEWEALRAFLDLPYQSPAKRIQTVRTCHLYKSTLTQTLGMCASMPRVKGRKAISL